MSEKSKKKFVFLFGCVMITLLIVAPLVSVLFWPQKNHHPVIDVTIQPGTNLREISELLYKNKIISNKKMFQLAVQILGKETKIPIGTFRLVKTQSNYQIIDQLVYGAPEVIKIRILEGWSIEKIAEYLSSIMGFEKDDIMALAEDQNFLNSNGIEANSLEGYLYPDTYFFFKGETQKSVLNHLVLQYKSFWKKSFKMRAIELGMSEHEILTLASIIEGEAIFDIERPKISAVYHNRLNIGMKLQADPTIQYIIDDGPRRLLNRDLRIQSPYNTYLNKGLPPGPINSPGRKSILAALYPEENDFFYFVAKGDGYHSFSTNEIDHNKAKKRLKKYRRSIKKKQKKI